MSLQDFKNLHEHEDVYVLGSGPSLTFVDPLFFTGKVVVATNKVAERLGLYDYVSDLYTVSHYHSDVEELAALHPMHDYFTPEGDQGFAGEPYKTDYPAAVNFYRNKVTSFDFDVDRMWPDDPDSELIVGSTSMHAAMHFACLLGASTVLMVGADCGMIDGQSNQSGYVSGNLDRPLQEQAEWLARWEKHLRAVANKLRSHYSVNIMSINPFINLNLESHVFQGWILGD